MARALRSRIQHVAQPIKGSRFIGTAAPIASETEAKSMLAEVAAEWPDASHHCWAWRLARPAIERAGDDGEPSGSAGRPMLAALVGRDLVDTAVIVTRWFGGTKLGVGGLVRAYGGTAAATLDAGSFEAWVQRVEIEFTHSPSDTNAVERVLARIDGVVELSVEWAAETTRRVQMPVDAEAVLWDALADSTQGRVRPDDS